MIWVLIILKNNLEDFIINVGNFIVCIIWSVYIFCVNKDKFYLFDKKVINEV